METKGQFPDSLKEVAEGARKQPVETGTVEAKTAERQDDPQASPEAHGSRPRKVRDMPRVDPRGSLNERLQDRWTLWRYRKDTRCSWKDNLTVVSSFQTMEDFWTVYNNMKPVSKLNQGYDYSLFRFGIEPAWEDDPNKYGGHWVLDVDSSRRDLDKDWLEVMLCLVGEGFGEHSGDVCGAVVQVRTRGDKIAVWTTDSNHEVANLVIGRTLKEKLEMPSLIPYRSHADIMRAPSGSKIRPMYMV